MQANRDNPLTSVFAEVPAHIRATGLTTEVRWDYPDSPDTPEGLVDLGYGCIAITYCRFHEFQILRYLCRQDGKEHIRVSRVDPIEEYGWNVPNSDDVDPIEMVAILANYRR